ncbi:uncharacterized protein Gasu_18790 [Galdieria sulphuraria]|uniref:Uncharacterized protein n=1 Tax=Galdieria sulphuraria TaxID=130081 RepID=M2X3A6_GALSU|nr:uncharacterized protein Gasu_18790 [Galdieria sulphuraria]EME30865.1 hypothetical protein Gasu_18790 [Galdieria sulphuraria]|eukprot:XP_005707385.1 hypothetical protein Gasu_18790 [Galdieria sulphuraria]
MLSNQSEEETMWFGLSRPRSSSFTYSTRETVTLPEDNNKTTNNSKDFLLSSLVKEKEAALERAQTEMDLLQERIEQLTHQLHKSEQLCEDLRKKCFVDTPICTNQDNFGPIQMRVDGAGYTGHQQTARVWIGNMFITWLKVPVDEEDNPLMEKAQPIANSNSPVYVPTIDDIGYQLIAECHWQRMRGPVVATSHSVTIEYDPDLLKVMVSLLKSGRAEFDAFYVCKENNRSSRRRREEEEEEEQQRVPVSIIIKRHKTKFSYHSVNSYRVVQLYYERCKQVTDITLELETSSPCFAFKLRFPSYVMDSKAEDTQVEEMEEHCFYTRTSADRDLMMATIRESLKLFFGQASPAVKKGIESDNNLFQIGAHRVRDATRKIFHIPSSPSSSVANHTE